MRSYRPFDRRGPVLLVADEDGPRVHTQCACGGDRVGSELFDVSTAAERQFAPVVDDRARVLRQECRGDVRDRLLVVHGGGNHVAPETPDADDRHLLVAHRSVVRPSGLGRGVAEVGVDDHEWEPISHVQVVVVGEPGAEEHLVDPVGRRHAAAQQLRSTDVVPEAVEHRERSDVVVVLRPDAGRHLGEMPDRVDLREVFDGPEGSVLGIVVGAVGRCGGQEHVGLVHRVQEARVRRGGAPGTGCSRECNPTGHADRQRETEPCSPAGAELATQPVAHRPACRLDRGRGR